MLAYLIDTSRFYTWEYFNRLNKTTQKAELLEKENIELKEKLSRIEEESRTLKDEFIQISSILGKLKKQGLINKK